ncbi:MAG TPA: hypothetical protein VN706_19730 [Gemmatimonadaceae bacterium]|nr:hypothetical protein [Gemmatimonadaceae bacterium]
MPKVDVYPVGRCENCGARVMSDYSLRNCSACGTSLSPDTVEILRVKGALDKPGGNKSVVGGQAYSPSASTPGGRPNPALRRYSDAYLVARTIVAVGTTVKIIGVVLGILIAVAGLLTGQGGVVAAAVIGGVVAGVTLYVTGVLVSSVGQLQQATLDSAVNSSPFLTDIERATAMSLPVQFPS